MTAACAEGLLDTDLARALLHADQHDVHQADAGDAKRERADKEQQRLKRDRDQAKLRELLHDVCDEDGVTIRWAKGVRRPKQSARRLLDRRVVATVGEPDAVEIAGILDG